MAKNSSAKPLQIIDGEAFKKMILAAAAEVDAAKEEINALNVFPVPDGDTGTNMSLTLNNAAQELSKISAQPLYAVAQTAANALLRGARGNSGVITSLIFRGIAKTFANHENADGALFATALSEASSTAYKAVMKPAEGTILTVSRIAAESACKLAKKEKNAVEVLKHAIKNAEIALENTIEQNPTLKKAGVVDAGGYGYLLILRAMLDAVDGDPQMIEKIISKPKTEYTVESADFSEFDTEEILFTYCTELMIKRSDTKKDPGKLRAYLAKIGDCVVVVDSDELIKVHVHTEMPDRVLGEGIKYGSLIAVKVENMREQHQNKVQNTEKKEERKIAEPAEEYGFVSVAAGEGICSVFNDLGVSSMVEGGQTMNPSTDDILKAIDATPAKTVFVLPNNKNIILAAQQAVPLSEKNVVVLESKTVPQGICALLAFDAEKNAEENLKNMTEAMTKVGTGQITYAARNSDFDGKKIKEGEYLALLEGKLIAYGSDFGKVIDALAKKMCEKGAEFITVFSGEGSSDELSALVTKAFKKYAENVEINEIPGGQPVYSYILSAE